MRSFKASSLFVLAGALLSSSALLAQSSNIAPRITSEVDESSLTTLKGNVPRLARAEFDQGEADAATQLTSMRLVLSRSSEQQAALDSYLAQLQDKSSPNYHKWLTPQQFGQLYGPADSDISALVAWLQSHGFTVEPLSPGRTNIAFSGSVSQVEAAFRTSIHSYQTADSQFYSNTTDPQIPSALAGVVMGIAHLNTIRPRPHSVRAGQGRVNQQTGRAEPNFIPVNGPSPMLTSGGSLYIVPADAATIYDTPNSYNANYTGTGCGSSAGCTGTGVKIGIGGVATIGTGSIVQTYRNTFLGSSYNTAPTIIPTGGNLATDAADVDEAHIDNELSGGLAPGASIYYYPSEDLTSGIDTGINANVVDIFSLSYGACEADMGTGGNALLNSYWEQAAGQGIAVTVSTGDTGSTSCDGDRNGKPKTAIYGLSVSGYASTPYNVAVGGTDYYALESSFSSYVSTSAGTAGAPTYYRTAKSYIPESIWNDSAALDTQPLADNAPNSSPSIVAGSGGVSSCATGSGNTCAGYPRPAWQAGSGIPATVPSGVNANARALPDVSVMSGNGYDLATWLVCDTEEPCSSISGGIYDGYGGTSTAAPAFAGILALVQQKTGNRLGQAAQELYALYNGSHAASVFHDVATGNNSVPCVSGTPNCALDSASPPSLFETGYNALTGYDLASGLGSVDATQLVNYWNSSIGSAAATVAVTPSPNPVTTAQSLVVTVSVSGSSGTPTGTVTLISGSYDSGAQTLTSSGTCTAASCAITVPAGNLAVGTDTLKVTYSGDTTYATTTNSSTTVQVNGLTPGISVSAPSTLSSNYPLAVTVTLSATGSGGTPTGTVQLTGPYIYTQVLNSSGVASFIIPADSYQTSGNDNLSAYYEGDKTYAPVYGSATVAVTYVPVLIPTVTVTPASNTVDASQSLNVTTAVTGSGATPTGTVTLTTGSYNSGAQALGTTGCTAGSCVTITIPANSLTGGIDMLTSNYSGDPNYYPSTGVGSVTVTPPVFALAATTPAAIAPGGTATSTITVNSSTGYAGIVTLTCALTTSPSGATDLPTCAATGGRSTVTLSSGTTSGTTTFTVSTTAASAALVYPKLPGKVRGLFGAGSGALLALLLFFGIPARRRSWRSMLGILLVMAALGSLAACGGGGTTTTPPPNSGTTAGNYTFTITGAGNPNVTPAPTTTFTVTVN